QIGFLDLLAKEKSEVVIHVERVELNSARRIDQDGVGREAKFIEMIAKERPNGGGGYVRTAAHWFGEDYVRGSRREVAGRSDQAGKPTAEAPTRYLPGQNSVCAGEVRIHETIALIVEDGGSAHPAAL